MGEPATPEDVSKGFALHILYHRALPLILSDVGLLAKCLSERVSRSNAPHLEVHLLILRI